MSVKNLCKLFVSLRNIAKLNNVTNSNNNVLRNHLKNYCTNEQKPNEMGLIYDKKIEDLMNEQINLELCAGYTYLNLASYYGRPDVALPGLHGYFMKMFYEEIEHTVGFVKYQNLRGGVIKYSPIQNQENIEWSDISGALTCALELETIVKQNLTKISNTASACNDLNACDWLDNYIKIQEESICEILRLKTRAAQLVSSEIGRYLFDRELHQSHVCSEQPQCSLNLGKKEYS